jgi:hypothetical protein
MRNRILLVLALFLMIGAVSAQKKSKEEVAEEKEWAKKLKLLKPLDYKRLVEEKESMANQLQEAQNQTSQCQSEMKALQAEVDRLKQENQTLKTAPQPNANNGGGGNNSSQANTAGLIFKVQIGAFRNKDLSKYFNNNKNFSGDIDPDGTKKYTLGNFTDYWEADNFKKYLREMGVEDAWVVAYRNGTRIPLKEALESIGQ